MISMGKVQSIHRAISSEWHRHGLGERRGESCRPMTNQVQNKTWMTTATRLRVGFVPLTDCAPLVVAHELGLFQKYGLRVELHRELGWATIRDKIIYRELEAAHALAAMPIAATLGVGSMRCDCLSGLVLNLHGNAITLSNDLRARGVRDGTSLRELIRSSRHEKTFAFGAVASVSSHLFLLRKWLMDSGVHPDRDVRIVIVPPPQMVTNLKAGLLDGFCVGEPWNSLAVQSRAGWCVAVSAELAPGHPEKVLMVRRDFAEKRPEEHLALIAALLDACEFCEQSDHHSKVIAMLARPQYVGAPEATLRRGFSGEFDFGHGKIRHVPNFNVFHRNNANEPSMDKAAWLLQQLRASGLCKDASVLTPGLASRVFRPDYLDEGVRLRTTKHRDHEKSIFSRNQLAPA
jgi:ABC-type nitrate/sulfonate/bicarbonate transport system substrate-binding protein